MPQPCTVFAEKPPILLAGPLHQKKQGRAWGYLLILLLHSSLSPVAAAQSLPNEFNAQELQRQQESERALREQQELTPNVSLRSAVLVEA